MSKNRTYIYYDPDTDFLEIQKGKNKTNGEDIGKGIFALKTSHGKVVGYSVIDGGSRLDELVFLDPFLKFAIQVKIARLKRKFTQVQMAKKMGIGLLPYQRLESGDNNPTLKTILKLKEILPEVSVDQIAS